MRGGSGGLLFRLTCWVVLWRGRDAANKYPHCVWGVLAVSGPHRVCPLRMACVVFRSTLLRLQVTLQGKCLEQALGWVHVPGLSHSGSGSRVIHKGTYSGGPAFCALKSSKQLRRPGAWWVHSPQVAGVASYHLPCPGHLVSLGCVSSGELISGCNPPGGCQLSRVPGRLG